MIHSSTSSQRFNIEHLNVMLKNHIYRKVVDFVDHDDNEVLQDNNIWVSVLQPAFV